MLKLRNLRVEFRDASVSESRFFSEFVRGDDCDLAFAIDDQRATIATVLLDGREEGFIQRPLGEQMHRNPVGWWKRPRVHTARLKSARMSSNATFSHAGMRQHTRSPEGCTEISRG